MPSTETSHQPGIDILRASGTVVGETRQLLLRQADRRTADHNETTKKGDQINQRGISSTTGKERKSLKKQRGRTSSRSPRWTPPRKDR